MQTNTQYSAFVFAVRYAQARASALLALPEYIAEADRYKAADACAVAALNSNPMEQQAAEAQFDYLRELPLPDLAEFLPKQLRGQRPALPEA